MDQEAKEELYNQFITSLKKAKSDGLVKILHRGVSKEFAFPILGLDPKFNNIDQFAERLFFFGDKAKYFWQQRSDSIWRKFDINDISNDIFAHIFNSFNHIISDPQKSRTKYYLKNNQQAKNFFGDNKNLSVFIDLIHQLTASDKTLYRNYYLRIIHELNETSFKSESFFVSSSLDIEQATKFSKNDIIINFWDFSFSNNGLINSSLALFKGRPYKEQKEISLFTAIFPHYIYSFTYKGKQYINPALYKTTYLEVAILSGFDIDQSNFPDRLIEETEYKKSIQSDGTDYHVVSNDIE